MIISESIALQAKKGLTRHLRKNPLPSKDLEMGSKQRQNSKGIPILIFILKNSHDYHL